MKQWLKRLFGTAKQEPENITKAYESLPLPVGSPEEIAQSALKAWKKRDLQGALELYNRAIALMPNEASLYLNRGNLKMELKLIDGAITDLQEAVSREPDLPVGNLELLKMMKGNPDLLAAFLKKQEQKRISSP